MSNNDALLEMTQAYLNFSDEEMDLFKTNPRNIEILPQIPHLLNTDFTFEVIEAQGCICQHKVGQKIIINGDGSVSKEQGPEKVCVYLPGRKISRSCDLCHASQVPSNLC